jgi:hypothetical protein
MRWKSVCEVGVKEILGILELVELARLKMVNQTAMNVIW